MTPDEQAQAIIKSWVTDATLLPDPVNKGWDSVRRLELLAELTAALRARERAVWEEAAKGAEADLTGDPEDAVNIYLQDYSDWCRQRAEGVK